MDVLSSAYAFLNTFFEDEGELMEIEQRKSSLLLILASGKRLEMPKVDNYMEVIDKISMYQNIDDFKMHYRLHRATFDFLLSEIYPALHHNNRGGSEPVAPEKQLLIFLNFIGNQQCMRECAHLFGLSKSTVHGIIHNVTNAVLELKERVIQWPNSERQREIARAVELSSGIPGVVGFIDGTHIRLASAPEGDRSFYNRKGYPSIQLQVVVDNQLLITSAYTGWPGCTHDARVLRNSQLYHNAEGGRAFLQNHHLLADNAYPLRNWIISPFKNYGNLTRQQQRFNHKLSSARQTVERAFGHLKGRFRRLKEVTLHNPQDIAKLIMAGCVLHNLCVLNTDDLEDFTDNNEDDDPNACQNIYLNGSHGVARRLRLLQCV